MLPWPSPTVRLGHNMTRAGCRQHPAPIQCGTSAKMILSSDRHETNGNIPGLECSSAHLLRPGPQPHNQIGTLRQMLALARTPRQTPEQEAETALAERVEKIVRRVLVEELPPAVEYLIKSRHGGQNGKA